MKNKTAEVGQRVRITFGGMVGYGKFAYDILWSSVEGVMGENGEIHQLTYNGQDIMYPKDTVVFWDNSYRIIEAGTVEEFDELLCSMGNFEIAVLRWENSVAVIEKCHSTWCFPGSEREYTTKEIAEIQGLLGISKLSDLL